MLCKNCGYEIDDDAVFCQWCGYAQTDDNFNARSQKPKNEQYNPKKNTSSRPVWIFVLVTALVIAIFLMFFSQPSSQSNAPSQNSYVSSSTSSAKNASDLKYEVITVFCQNIQEMIPTITGKYDFDYSSYVFTADDDVIATRIDFSSPNAFGVDLKYTVTAVYEYLPESFTVNLVSLYLDDEIVFEGQFLNGNNSDSRSILNKDKLLNAAHRMVLNASANPNSVQFFVETVSYSTDDQGNSVVKEKFSRISSAGNTIDEFYTATISASSSADVKPIALKVGDNLLYDYRINPIQNYSSSGNASVNENGEVVKYHHDFAGEGMLYDSSSTGDSELDKQLAMQNFMDAYSNAK